MSRPNSVYALIVHDKPNIPLQHFTESRKVNYAILKLEADALDCWVVFDVVITEDARRAMKLEICSQQVQDCLCTPGKIRKIELEFLTLENGFISIWKYNTMFYEKLQFVKGYCPTDVKQVEHYTEGLPTE